MTITNVDEIIALIALYRPGPMIGFQIILKEKDPSTIKFLILYWKRFAKRLTELWFTKSR